MRSRSDNLARRPHAVRFLQGVPDVVTDLPEPLPEEESGEWGDPIMVDDDSERPGRDDDPADAPIEEDGPEIAVDEDEVPPTRGPESEPP